jgi:hypothetical protein
MNDLTERARAAARELGDLDAQLAALQQMTVPELLVKYRELYGEPTRSRNRDYLRKRLCWRVQELAEGGLPPRALEKIVELGDQLPERWRMREKGAYPLPEPPKPSAPRDPRLPPVGTVLTRAYRGEIHQVVVRVDGVEYQGEQFRSLSAVARKITGTPWNGYAFFKIDNAAPGAVEEQAP